MRPGGTTLKLHRVDNECWIERARKEVQDVRHSGDRHSSGGLFVNLLNEGSIPCVRRATADVSGRWLCVEYVEASTRQPAGKKCFT